MTRSFRPWVFFGIVAVMALLNATGIRYLLAGAPDPSRVPLARMILVAAGLEPRALAPGYLLQGDLLSSRMTEQDGTFSLAIPRAPERHRGQIDRIATSDPGHIRIHGWVLPREGERDVPFVGARMRGLTLSVVTPNLLRPEVTGAGGLPTLKPGFVLEAEVAASEVCAVGVFVIDASMHISWLREPTC